jgi:hypothetical protein
VSCAVCWPNSVYCAMLRSMRLPALSNCVRNFSISRVELSDRRRNEAASSSADALTSPLSIPSLHSLVARAAEIYHATRRATVAVSALLMKNRRQAKPLTRDKARQIAANIAGLPELLKSTSEERESARAKREAEETQFRMIGSN